MLFWRLELLVYAGEPITNYGVQVAAGLHSCVSCVFVALCYGCASPVFIVCICPLDALAACVHMCAGPGYELWGINVPCSIKVESRTETEGRWSCVHDFVRCA